MHKFGILLAFAMMVGCGDGGGQTTGQTGSNGGGTTGGGTTGGSSLTIYCCLNGAYYDCPSQAALDKCIPPNFMSAPDPSACTRNAGKDGTCRSGGGSTTTGGGGGGGGCSGASSWGACSIDADCHSSQLHCTSGHCYSNIFGSPCNIDADCGSDTHCTSGCCYTNMSGNPCDIDADCGSSSSCVSGKCN
jgi:hypothetical protein